MTIHSILINQPADATVTRMYFAKASQGGYFSSKLYGFAAIILTTFNSPLYVVKAGGEFASKIAQIKIGEAFKALGMNILFAVKSVLSTAAVIILLAVSIFVPCRKILSVLKQYKSETEIQLQAEKSKLEAELEAEKKQTKTLKEELSALEKLIQALEEEFSVTPSDKLLAPRLHTLFNTLRYRISELSAKQNTPKTQKKVTFKEDSDTEIAPPSTDAPPSPLALDSTEAQLQDKEVVSPSTPTKQAEDLESCKDPTSPDPMKKDADLFKDKKQEQAKAAADLLQLDLENDTEELVTLREQILEGLKSLNKKFDLEKDSIDLLNDLITSYRTEISNLKQKIKKKKGKKTNKASAT